MAAFNYWFIKFHENLRVGSLESVCAGCNIPLSLLHMLISLSSVGNRLLWPDNWYLAAPSLHLTAYHNKDEKFLNLKYTNLISP